MEHRRTFPARADQLRVARNLVAGALSDWSEQRRQDAILVANELLANAIRHGAGDVELAVQIAGDAVTIRVRDSGSSDEPVVGPPDTAAAASRGLRLVEALADSWGWHRLESGTDVWCQLDRTG